jgi:hypothetical protein
VTQSEAHQHKQTKFKPSLRNTGQYNKCLQEIAETTLAIIETGTVAVNNIPHNITQSQLHLIIIALKLPSFCLIDY